MFKAVTDQMLQDAVKYTEDEMQVKGSRCTKSHIKKCIYYDTSLIELKAFIGLMYLAGISHYCHRNETELWKRDGSKYGIKTYNLVYMKFYYAFNLAIYARTQPSGPYL